MQIEIFMNDPLAHLFVNPLFTNPEKHTTCPVHVVTRLGSSRELKLS
jgi:hypothetical protein